MTRLYRSYWSPVWATGFWLLTAVQPVLALDRDFTLTLQTLPGKVAMCHLSFENKVPGRKVVDQMLLQAMSLCRILKPNIDMEGMAFAGDDALETGKDYSGAMEWRKVDREPKPLMLGGTRL